MLTLGGGDYDVGSITFASDMELRDHFAGLALQAQVSNNDWFANNNTWKSEKEMFERHAKEAYNFADAMMKERENGTA